MSAFLLMIITFITSFYIYQSQCRELSLEYIQKISVYEGYNKKADFNLTMVKMIEEQELFYSNKGKICYLANYSEISTLDLFYNSFSREWIFLMDIKNEIMKFIKDVTKSKSKYRMSPLIIPKSLNCSFDEIMPFATIFQVDYDTFQDLKGYDIRRATGNYYFVINYGKSLKNAPIRYLAGMAFASIMISFWMQMLWKLRYDRTQSNSNNNNNNSNINNNNMNDNISLIGKNIVIFPILKIIISMLLYYKIKLIESGYNSYLQSKKYHVNYIILSFSVIFKALFWFFSIFISVGWELTFSLIDIRHLKNFLQKYVIIYCTLSIDEAIDNMFSLNNKYVSIK